MHAGGGRTLCGAHLEGTAEGEAWEADEAQVVETVAAD